MPASTLSDDAIDSAGLPRLSVVPPGSIRLQPARGWRPLELLEIWRYRELIWFLAIRDVKLRYKQTILGVAWAVLQPAINVLVFTLFFNKVAGVDSSGGKPYPVSTLCALIPWQLFEAALTQASGSLVASQNIITKIYFPRLCIPIAAVLSALPDFLVSAALLVLMMVWYHITPGWNLIALPAFVLLSLVAAFGVGSWLSALNVTYRDVRYAVPFLARIWFFATPIVYSADRVKAKLGPVSEQIYSLNPMAGVVEGFRWTVLGTPAPSLMLLLISTAASIVVFIGGLFYFRRMEHSFADLI